MSRFLRETPFWAIEATPDPDIRVYYSRIRLLNDDKFSLALLQGAQFTVGLDLEPVAEILLNIRGVTAVELRANYFVVRRTPVFSWDEIEDEIINLLRGIKIAEHMETAAAEGFAIIHAAKPKPRMPRVRTPKKDADGEIG